MGRERAVGERNVGVRMAATWLMDTLTPSPLFLSLMSTFATLPFFLFTLPSGALADMFDRKKLLCLMNLWLAMVAAGLAIANLTGLAHPYLILGTVFLLGIGFASMRRSGRRSFRKLSQRRICPRR